MTKFLLPLLALLVAGCTAISEHPGNTKSADTAFKQLANDYLSGYLAWRPQTGTSLGFHEYDGKLTDFSKPSLNGELARLKTFNQKLEGIDPSQLSAAESRDLRLLRLAVQREIFSFEQMQVYTQNPMTYANAIDVSVYIKRNFASLENRVRSIISILNQTPNVMAAARANLDESLPRPHLETAIEEAGGAADFLAKDLVEALKDLKDPKLMAEFKEVDDRAINEYRQFVTYLKEQKLPKASTQYALGREKYIKLLEYGEMVTLSPEQVLELGMQELHKKQKVFAQAAALIEPGKEPISVFKAIQKDHPTAESLIPDTARDLEMIRKFVVDHHIITIPSTVRAKVDETPKFLRASSFASMDTPGPFESKATEAYYYVTPVEPEWPAQQKDEWLTAFNYYTTDIVSIHEAYPGHYVQFLCLNASPANKLEKIFGSYAFIEGWAHYAEQMLVDKGFGKAQPEATSSAPSNSNNGWLKAAKYRLAQTDEALLRICRLCVSIKMHCQGMTVEEATKFFQDNCYYEEKPAHQEAVRGAFDPEYLYYTLGKLEILKLREDYQRQQGDSFTLQKFHDELLRHGAPPIRLLREVMLKDKNEWPNVL